MYKRIIIHPFHRGFMVFDESAMVGVILVNAEVAEREQPTTFLPFRINEQGQWESGQVCDSLDTAKVAFES